ncbi:hypothetical protein GR11A_00092 [Vibrio phage vB_VcorM_GR11A]|nr:hypothetical protein GR11A_00092 [Vibrio phage vB_VcorM_GR11A]
MEYKYVLALALGILIPSVVTAVTWFLLNKFFGDDDQQSEPVEDGASALKPQPINFVRPQRADTVSPDDLEEDHYYWVKYSEELQGKGFSKDFFIAQWGGNGFWVHGDDWSLNCMSWICTSPIKEPPF